MLGRVLPPLTERSQKNAAFPSAVVAAEGNADLWSERMVRWLFTELDLFLREAQETTAVSLRRPG